MVSETPIPQIPRSVLMRLSRTVTQLTAQDNLSAESLANALQQEATVLRISAQSLLQGIRAAMGEVGSNLAAGRVGQVASAARQIASAVDEIPPEAMRNALGAAAVTTTAVEGTGVAGTVWGGLTVGRLAVGGVLLLAAGLATYAGATHLGSKSGDKPVEYGAGATAQRGQAPGALPPGAPLDPYAVFLLTNLSNGSIWVGQESQLKGRFTCQFPGGGVCSGKKYTTGDPGADVPIQYSKKSSDFKTLSEATKAYCSALESPIKSIPLTGGAQAKIYGGSYWVNTAPSCKG